MNSVRVVEGYNSTTYTLQILKFVFKISASSNRNKRDNVKSSKSVSFKKDVKGKDGKQTGSKSDNKQCSGSLLWMF